MRARKLLLIISLLSLLSAGCGIFKKKCDCPRFGSVENRQKQG
jgi:hypothetical protein